MTSANWCLLVLTTPYCSLLTSWALKLVVTSAAVPLGGWGSRYISDIPDRQCSVWSSCDAAWTDNTTCHTPGHAPVTRTRFQASQPVGVVPALNLHNYFEDSPVTFQLAASILCIQSRASVDKSLF